MAENKADPRKKMTRKDMKKRKELTAKMQNWVRNRCREAPGSKVNSELLRNVCQQDLCVTFTAVHFGRTLRKVFPSVRTGNHARSGCNEQFVYGVVLANLPHQSTRQHSTRVCSTEIKRRQHQELIGYVLKKKEDGLKVVTIKDKGRGVVATKIFQRGDYIAEYAGDLISRQKAKTREEDYAMMNKGCYMYYFTFQDKSYCVDATAETGRLGRLFNHSRKHANCRVVPVLIRDVPHLIIQASTAINPGNELVYDYGDRSISSLTAHPWLAK